MQEQAAFTERSPAAEGNRQTGKTSSRKKPGVWSYKMVFLNSFLKKLLFWGDGSVCKLIDI